MPAAKREVMASVTESRVLLCCSQAGPVASVVLLLVVVTGNCCPVAAGLGDPLDHGWTNQSCPYLTTLEVCVGSM